jgi:8-oxo-dGTP pyrophosphatase MutT (NUDIX family)
LTDGVVAAGGVGSPSDSVPTSPALRPEDLPPALLTGALDFYAQGRTPAPPKMAATVLLLRSASPDRGFQVYAIRRVPTMPFAPGMYAFPGGSVDPRDADADVRWAGPDASVWGARFGQPPRVAQAIVCAAVREVFEESGVLLAGPDASTVVGDVSGDDWEAQRAALVARKLGFAELLRDRDLVLRGDLLAPWSRWITPEFEPRRYDTYFFLARLPDGQLTRNVGGEADEVRWLRPAERRELAMLPPTRATLAQLDAYHSIAELVTAAGVRDAATPVIPHLVGYGPGA